jgi:nucleoid DNA-binding protein
MPAPTKAQVISALAEIISEDLKKGNDVRVPGLGTFRVHHQVSQVERSPDGQVLMKPPRDVIAFSSDE